MTYDEFVETLNLENVEPMTPEDEIESQLIDALCDRIGEAVELYGDGCDERHVVYCAEAAAAWDAFKAAREAAGMKGRE